MESFIQKINTNAHTAIQNIHEYLDTCDINYRNPNDRSSGVVIINPTIYHWTIKDEQKSGQAQIIALRLFHKYQRLYNLLLTNFPENQIKKIRRDQDDIITLIERSRKAPSSIQFAKSGVEKIINNHLSLLQRLSQGERKTIIIPDTNSIIICPDPKAYEVIALKKQFTFILTPTLNRELDKLKITHRDETFRKKVKSIITRIKGYRNQGSLIEGVTYHKNITVQAIATEPKFEKLLSWLDPQNEDDRFIASVLEVIVGNPDDSVILVTADVNLQNKAELALITYAEPPENNQGM